MTDRPVVTPAKTRQMHATLAGSRTSAIPWPEIAVAAATLVATVWVGWLLLRRFEGLATASYDLGFFQQVIWNVRVNGSWASSFQPGSFLGLHFSPILVVPAAVQGALGADARVLIVLHALAVGALVPAAFLFLRAAFRPSPLAAPLATGLAIGIPIWAATQSVIRADFHPELAGVVLALLAGWAGLTRRPMLMWGMAIVALSTREDVAYAVALVALVVAVRGRGRMQAHGRGLLIVSIVAGIVIFGAVMPLLRDGAVSDTARYYRWLGDGTAILTAPLRIPDRLIAAIARPDAWFVVVGMIGAAAALPLLRPTWLLLLVPPLAALVLSAHPPQAAILFHYPVILMTPIIVATAMGVRRALALGTRAQRGRPGLGPRRGASVARPARGSGPLAPLLAVVVFVPALLSAVVQGSIPPFTHRDGVFPDRPAAVATLRDVARTVPHDAVLVADEGLVTPLADRAAIRRLTAVSRPPAEAYILVDRDAWSPSRGATTIRSRILASLPTSGRRVIADDGRFMVWSPQDSVRP